jgi:hypothetical protein
VSDMREVYPDLMGPPGMEFGAQQIAHRKAGQGEDVGAGGTAALEPSCASGRTSSWQSGPR